MKENLKLKEQNENMKRENAEFKEFQENSASNKKLVDNAIKKENYAKLCAMANALIKELFGTKASKLIEISPIKKEKDIGF